MKCKKIYIYIAMFFALFLVGVKKVSAASTHMMCKYTLTQKQANELDLNSAEKWKHGGYQLILYYQDGKLAHVLSNQPDAQKNDDYSLVYCLREFEGSGTHPGATFDVPELSDWIKIVKEGNATSCPKILITEHPESDSTTCSYKRTKIKYSGNEKDYYLSAKAEVVKLDKTKCVYTRKNSANVTVQIDYTRFQGLSGPADGYGTKYNTTNPAIILGSINDGNNEIIDLRTDGEYHTRGSLIRNYFLDIMKTGTHCPEYFYYNQKTKYHMLGFDGAINSKYTGGYHVYSLGCLGDDDADVKKVKQFINDNYDLKNKKVTATIDVALGKKIEAIKGNLDAVQKKYGSGQQTSKCKYEDSIIKPFKEIIAACNASDECANDATKNVDESLRKWSKTLGNFTGIRISDEVDCSILGDKDNPDDLMYVINRILTWIKIAVPIIVIVFGLVDFSKVVVSQDQDAMKKATSKFVKRCLVAVAIFFVPNLIVLLLGWIDTYISKDVNAKCVIDQLYILMNYLYK